LKLRGDMLKLRGDMKRTKIVTFTTIIALLATLVSFSIEFWNKKAAANRMAKLNQKYEERIDGIANKFKVIDNEINQIALSELSVDLEDSLYKWLSHVPSYLTESEIEVLVDHRLSKLEEKLQRIDKRFPDESTIEKIASVNDAILATKIEALFNSVDDIKRNMLTNWDIVKVVFGILTALGVLTGMIFGGMNVLKKYSERKSDK